MRRTDHHFSCCFNVLSASSPLPAADGLTQCGRRTTASVRYFFVPAADGKAPAPPGSRRNLRRPSTCPSIFSLPLPCGATPYRSRLHGRRFLFARHSSDADSPDQSNAHPPFHARTVTRQGAPNRLDAASVPMTTRPVFALFRKPPSSTLSWTKAPAALLSLLPQCYILLRADREAGHSSGEQP